VAFKFRLGVAESPWKWHHSTGRIY